MGAGWSHAASRGERDANFCDTVTWSLADRSRGPTPHVVVDMKSHARSAGSENRSSWRLRVFGAGESRSLLVGIENCLGRRFEWRAGRGVPWQLVVGSYKSVHAKAVMSDDHGQIGFDGFTVETVGGAEV